MSPAQSNTLPGSRDHWARFRRLVGLMTVIAAVAVVGSLYWLKALGTPMRPHMIIATSLGVGLSVLLAGVLMALVFVSNASGVDEQGIGLSAYKERGDDRR